MGHCQKTVFQAHWCEEMAHPVLTKGFLHRGSHATSVLLAENLSPKDLQEVISQAESCTMCLLHNNQLNMHVVG